MRVFCFIIQLKENLFSFIHLNMHHEANKAPLTLHWPGCAPERPHRISPHAPYFGVSLQVIPTAFLERALGPRLQRPPPTTTAKLEA